MDYEQCPVTELAPGYGFIRCVMFAGHKPVKILGERTQHLIGGLGPFTPGMDPAEYVRLGKTMVPWWRRLMRNLRGRS